MSKTRYNIDLVFANLFFGANFAFYVSLTRNYLDFQQIFMLQVLSAAVFFIPFALFSKQSFRIRWRDAGNILIVTMLIVYGWMYMLLWGSSYTSPIDASIISTLGPAVTLITDHLMHPHKYIRARVVGVVCALIGAAVLLFDHGFVLTHGSRAYGNALVLVAVVAIAINTVIIKPQLERLGTLVVMGWYYIIGLAVTAPFFWKYIAHTQFLKLPLQAQMQVLLPGIHSRDKYLHLLLYLPGGRPGQEQPIQKEGAVPVCGFPPKQLLGHILQILAGEKSVIIFLEPGCSLPAKGRVLLPLDAQTAEQQVQNLRAALYLPLLNFRQIGHSAYPITQRRLRPFPLLPPLPNEQPLQLLPQ